MNNKVLINAVTEDVLTFDELRMISKHEEAGVKIIPHVRNCVENGYQEILVKMVDTDVLIFMLAYASFFLTMSQI